MSEPTEATASSSDSSSDQRGSRRIDQRGSRRIDQRGSRRIDQRGSRRIIVGTVTSSNMDKTATVTVIRRVRDRRFHKFLTRRVKYHVHDEHDTAKVGDVVEIIESRPMSKTKRWRLLSTISRPADVGGHIDQPQVEK